MVTHPNYAYTWINPDDPDPINLIEQIDTEIFRYWVMRDAIAIRNTSIGSYFERVRTLDELVSIANGEIENFGNEGRQVSKEESKVNFQYLDQIEIDYGKGFLRFEQIGETDTFRIQDFSWNCLAC